MLGQKPETNERDAIHVAIIPIVAGELLRPGQRVGIEDNQAVAGGKIVGIVDPFLTDFVSKGATFWLCLLPDTVTGMRHHWEHPDFDQKIEVLEHPSKEESEKWLRNFCKHGDCPDFATIVEAIEGNLEPVDSVYGRWGTISSDYLHFDGYDAHGNIPDEFWYHMEIYLGYRLQVKPKHFSCSC